MEQTLYNNTIINEVKENSKWLRFMGLATLILGFVAVLFPFMASIAIELLIGWVFLVGGALNLVHNIFLRKWNGFGLSLITSLLLISTGGYLIFNPIEGALTLVYILGILFLIGGSARVVMAYQLKPARRWSMVLFNGLVTIILGSIILSTFPSNSLWILGLIIGIDLIFTGITFLFISSSSEADLSNNPSQL